MECRFSHCRFFQNLELSHCSFMIVPLRTARRSAFPSVIPTPRTIGLSAAASSASIGPSCRKAATPSCRFSFRGACTLEATTRLFSPAAQAHGFQLLRLGGSFFDECDLTESRFTGANLKGTLFPTTTSPARIFARRSDYAISLENNKLKSALFLSGRPQSADGARHCDQLTVYPCKINAHRYRAGPRRWLRFLERFILWSEPFLAGPESCGRTDRRCRRRGSARGRRVRPFQRCSRRFPQRW